MSSQGAETHIIQKLREGLAPTLTYHSLHHTLDVVQVSGQLAAAEGITDPEALALLRTAAFYHDAGFLNTYVDHELAGCAIARQILPEFGYSTDQIDQICDMIMATRIPQAPQTHLAQILCDADLDYLGRTDFEPIARTLFIELAAHRNLTDEHAWNLIQVAFLEKHQYWTATATRQRDVNKQIHLNQLQKRVALKN